MSDRNPGSYPVRVSVEYSKEANRLTTFFRLLMVIPHQIILYFVGIVAFIAMVALWLTIVVTGKRHEGMAGFLASYLRWTTRLNGYTFLLTDEYPPFSGDE